MWRPLPILSALLAVSLPALAQEVPTVVDGDTLRFGTQRVRIYGIDAPELHQTCEGGTWAAGKLAREALVELIGGQPVTCSAVIPNGKYKRPISTCSVGKMDLGGEMVTRGWAWAFTRYSDRYIDQEQRAQAERVGLHGHNCATAWKWRAARRREKQDD